MAQKKYFYKDKLGRTQKLIYCIRGCPQPYYQEQLETEIIKVTNHIHICKKCFDDLHMKKDSSKFLISLKKPNVSQKLQEIEDEPEVETEIIEEVSNITRKILYEIEDESEVQTKIIEDEHEVETEIETEIIKEVSEKERFFAYVVKCKDNSFYCGVTSNIENAIKNHNRGSGSPHTREKTRRPVCLVASRETNSTIDAKKIKVDYQKEYKE
jgi:putative endonuclease